jgi:hypothetical protein
MLSQRTAQCERRQTPEPMTSTPKWRPRQLSIGKTRNHRLAIGAMRRSPGAGGSSRATSITGVGHCARRRLFDGGVVHHAGQAVRERAPGQQGEAQLRGQFGLGRADQSRRPGGRVCFGVAEEHATGISAGGASKSTNFVRNVMEVAVPLGNPAQVAGVTDPARGRQKCLPGAMRSVRSGDRLAARWSCGLVAAARGGSLVVSRGPGCRVGTARR